MFRTSPNHPQIDLLSSAGQHPAEPAIRASARRQAISKRTRSERNKRNNVEASIWHLTHTLRRDKTPYRGLIKHKLWAWCRVLWVNIKRIQRYIGQPDGSG